MPNIKSSIRSVKTDAERRAKNAPVKAAIRNIARKVVALTETGTQEDAKATYVTASGLIDKPARKVLSTKTLQTAENPDLQKKSMLWSNFSVY